MLAQQCEALNGTESYALKWFLVCSMNFTSIKIEQRVREGVARTGRKNGTEHEGRTSRMPREHFLHLKDNVTIVSLK